MKDKPRNLLADRTELQTDNFLVPIHKEKILWHVFTSYRTFKGIILN